ncbi:PREDICTED: 2-oxo-4-hydroxy-4-carboxy-5-ureidoimidazoline decarboxylase-like [Nicrophorus vespilloides]|uniref:2-oxo-4-hydroxy-4-carboxy-5-ureidoimidazoline decarboxylase n=1 Tax=Nicrophorus vespilloides TaxID=110193 RepID=A0ABM1NAH2_NICVS|nr:PREDICTED: 2-oxo-4-hydroxy-4-carboxy-5-ureidoimidazoline decarboxylase-like [Nicrophorus vespilloides]
MQSITKKITIQEVNSLNEPSFTQFFGNIIEHCPSAAIAIFKKKPFDNIIDIYDGIISFLRNISLKEKVEILKMHPDLAGKFENTVNLTIESQKEQQSAGLHLISLDETEELRQLNNGYKLKFGFPFVICARDNTIVSIVRAIKERINNEEEYEVGISMKEVEKIAMKRINDIINL